MKKTPRRNLVISRVFASFNLLHWNMQSLKDIYDGFVHAILQNIVKTCKKHFKKKLCFLAETLQNSVNIGILNTGILGQRVHKTLGIAVSCCSKYIEIRFRLFFFEGPTATTFKPIGKQRLWHYCWDARFRKKIENNANSSILPPNPLKDPKSIIWSISFKKGRVGPLKS